MSEVQLKLSEVMIKIATFANIPLTSDLGELLDGLYEKGHMNEKEREAIQGIITRMKIKKDEGIKSLAALPSTL